MRLQSAVHKSEMPIYEETIAVCKFTETFLLEERDEVTMDGN